LFRIISSDAREKVCTFVEFTRSITPHNRGQGERKSVLCICKETLEVRTTKLAHGVHKIYDRTIVALDNDIERDDEEENVVPP